MELKTGSGGISATRAAGGAGGSEGYSGAYGLEAPQALLTEWFFSFWPAFGGSHDMSHSNFTVLFNADF